MTDKHIDSRKTYAVQRNTLEALGIELVIAKKEYEKQLHYHTHLIVPRPLKSERPTEYEVFYSEQIEYLDGLINHLHEVTNDELLLI